MCKSDKKMVEESIMNKFDNHRNELLKLKEECKNFESPKDIEIVAFVERQLKYFAEIKKKIHDLFENL